MLKKHIITTPVMWLVCRIVVVLCLCVLPPWSLAQSQNTTSSGSATKPMATNQASSLYVVQPTTKKSHLKVYNAIIQGVKTTFSGKVIQKQLPVDDSSIKSGTSKQMVLALGKEAFEVMAKQYPTTPIMVGGVMDDHYTASGFTMSPAARLVLTPLAKLAPQVKRVHVVKKAGYREYQLQGAEHFLEQKGVQLIIHPVDNLREAAVKYKSLADQSNEKDAVWILQSGSYVNRAILSLLLDSSWNKQFVIFSSTPRHVQDGVLYAVYPSMEGLGEALGVLANKISAGEKVDNRVRPLMRARVLMNERTANHQGVILPAKIKRNPNLLLRVE